MGSLNNSYKCLDLQMSNKNCSFWMANATDQWQHHPANEDCPAYFNKHHKNFLLSMLIINSTVAFVAVLLNLLVMIVFAKTTSLRTPANILVLGLAVSDLGIAIFSQPVFCVWIYTKLFYMEQLQHIFGTIFYYSFLLQAFVSFGTLTTISADRFLAIHFHLRYKELVTTRRYAIVFAIIWMTSIAFLICRLFVNHYNRIILELMESIILVALNAYFFFKVSQAINKHSEQIESQQHSSQHSINIPRYRRSVKTMYYVILPFVFCYVPFIASLIAVRAVRQEMNESMCVLLTVTPTLLMLSGILNPLIYCVRNREIRSAVSKLLHKTFHKSDNDRHT